MQNQKLHEQKVLRSFLKLIEELPKVKVVSHESPDFLLKLNAKKAIGLELTELHGQDFINSTGKLKDPDEVFNHIRETISAKDEKVYLYRKKRLHQLWLLIYLKTLSNTVNFHLENKFMKLSFDSDFDRVFLLELDEEKLYELES